MSTAIITLDHLSVHANGQTLVEPISLSLYQGQSLTILGETGSGKSLLALYRYNIPRHPIRGYTTPN